MKTRVNNRALVLKRNQPLMETLTSFACDEDISSAVISGIGALKNIELGYYDLNSKEYLRRRFDDDNYELVSLAGNIAIKDNKPFVHSHVVLGDRDFRLFGGHLFEGVVAVTAEIIIQPMDVVLSRSMVSEIGLALIEGHGCSHEIK